MHELLREAGGCAISVLAAGQEWLAQHFARGVPPIAMWHKVGTDEGANGAPLLVGALGWLECAVSQEIARARTRSSSARCGASSSARTRRRSFACAASTERVRIEAVVFDLDGVLVDSEHVWDEVREELARERGGRWHERAQADMMGMSSTEWSRYMHDVIGLAESPEEINDEVVRRMRLRYAEDLPLVAGAVEAVRRLGGRVPARARVVVEPAADRRGARGDGPRRGVRGDGLVRGGRAREACARRLPGGGPPAGRRPGGVRGDRGLGERHPLRARRGDAGASRSRTGAIRRRRTRSRSRTSCSVARRAHARAVTPAEADKSPGPPTSSPPRA